MLTMNWKLTTGPDGRRELAAGWTPVVIPVPRPATDDAEARVPALRAS
jgi:hypothetical protein